MSFHRACCCAICDASAVKLSFSGIDANPCNCVLPASGESGVRHDPIDINVDDTYQIGTIGTGVWQSTFTVTNAVIWNEFLSPNTTCAAGTETPQSPYNCSATGNVLAELVVDCVNERIDSITLSLTENCGLPNTVNSGFFFYNQGVHGGSYWLGDSVPNGLSCPPTNTAISNGGTATWTRV